MVQGLRRHASTEEGMSLTPGRGTKTSHATWHGKKKGGGMERRDVYKALGTF